MLHSNTTGDRETCRMYNYNYTEVAEMGYEAAMVNKPSLTTLSPDPVECSVRDFNYSQYQSTVVTEVSTVLVQQIMRLVKY